MVDEPSLTAPIAGAVNAVVLVKAHRLEEPGRHVHTNRQVAYQVRLALTLELAMAHQPPLDPADPPTSIAILRLSAIGDCCHMVPVVRSLQAAWPQTRLTWLIGRTEAQLIGDLDGVEFITFDKRRGAREYRRIRRTLAGRRFDALLHAQVALRANILATAVRANRRIGFDRARSRDAHGWFINERIRPQREAHVMTGFFGFAEALGVTERQLHWDIPVPDQAASTAAAHIDDGEPALVISPCSSQRFRNFRNWQPESYAAVADHAAKRGMKVLVTGGPSREEQRYGEAIERLSRAPVVNLVGRTGLKELFALLGRATAVLAPDSGPVHMAIAAGTPVIGLYATSNPRRTGPALGQQWVVNAYPEAVRRAFGVDESDIAWGRRVRDPEALSLISVAAVTERLDDLLATPTDQRLAN